jgi:hypothetical protein
LPRFWIWVLSINGGLKYLYVSRSVIFLTPQ